MRKLKTLTSDTTERLSTTSHCEEVKNTYFFHKPLAESRGNPFPGMNSTVHPNNLLGVIGRLADLEGTFVFHYQTIAYDCKPLWKVIRFWFIPLHFILSPSILWFQGWGKAADKDTHQYDPPMVTLALFRLPWLLFLGQLTDSPVSPSRSLVSHIP